MPCVACGSSSLLRCSSRRPRPFILVSRGGLGPLCHASPPAVPRGLLSFLLYFFHLFCCAVLLFVLLLHPLSDCTASTPLSAEFPGGAFALLIFLALVHLLPVCFGSGVCTLCPALRVALRLCVALGCACIATPPCPPYGPSPRVFRGVSRDGSAPSLAGGGRGSTPYGVLLFALCCPFACLPLGSPVCIRVSSPGRLCTVPYRVSSRLPSALLNS